MSNIFPVSSPIIVLWYAPITLFFIYHAQHVFASKLANNSGSKHFLSATSQTSISTYSFHFLPVKVHVKSIYHCQFTSPIISFNLMTYEAVVIFFTNLPSPNPEYSSILSQISYKSMEILPTYHRKSPLNFTAVNLANVTNHHVLSQNSTITLTFDNTLTMLYQLRNLLKTSPIPSWNFISWILQI
jgi:hypothetical protein